MGLWFSSLPGKEGGRTLGYSQFSTQALRVGGAGSYPEPWPWINPLSVPSMWMLHSQYWLCSGGQSAMPACLKHHWATLLPEVFARPSGPMGLEGIVHKGRTMILLPAWANWAEGLAKPLVWRSELCRYAPHWVPWSECTLIWFCVWAKPLTGINTWVLQIWTQSAKIYVPVIISPFWPLCHSQIPSGQAPQISLQSLWKSPQMLLQSDPQGWGLLSVPLGVFFFFSYCRNWRLKEDLSAWCCAGLGEGQCTQYIITSFSLLMQSILVSVLQWVL